MDAFPLLRSEQEEPLFGIVQKGYEQARKTPDLSDLSRDQLQACLGMAIAWQQIYLSNLRLVCKLARDHKNLSEDNGVGLPFSDLFQEGSLGLADAINRFDNSKKMKFSTYATPWIKGAIGRADLGKFRIVYVPEGIQQKWKKVDTAVEIFRTQYQREPSPKEIAALGGLSIDESVQYSRFQRQIQTFDELPISVRDKASTADSPGSDTHIDDLIAHDLAKRTRNQVYNLLHNSELTPQEQLVITLWFGTTSLLTEDFQVTRKDKTPVDHKALVLEREMTGEFPKKQVAAALGIGEKRLSQIVRGGLAKMKQHMQLENSGSDLLHLQ